MTTTAKQKKTDEKVAEPKGFAETLKELKQHVDPNLIRQREGWRDRNGNVQMVDYLEWHTVADILDELAPSWQSTVKDIRQIGDLMAVTVAITIDGITRDGIGTGLAQTEMGIKKAEHDALKRAAVKFGVGRELYKKESDVIEREGGSASSYSGSSDGGFPTNPVARSLGELVTARQMGMIRAIARDLNIDPDEECNAVMACNVDELTKRAASALIQHLQDLQGKGDARPRVVDHSQAPYLKREAGGAQPQGAIRNPQPIKLAQPMINKLRLAIKKAEADEANMAALASEGRVESIEYLTTGEAEICLATVESM